MLNPTVLAEARGADSCTGESAPLVDRFGRLHDYLRVSITDRCGFRCGYCMPADGMKWRPREELLTADEIVRAATVFARAGVRKVRLTGGEPTARPDLLEIVERIARIPGIGSLGLTTNGVRLRELAEPLHRAGLTALNVSLDSLDPVRFKRITRRDVLATVRDGIEAAADTVLALKINMVVMAGVNSDEIVPMVRAFQHRSVCIRFIEFMPFRNNGWQAAELYPCTRILADLGSAFRLREAAPSAAAVAREFAVEGLPVRVGVIASMTRTFCAECSRVRLTADGQVRSCLFLPAEADLRGAMRAGASDDELDHRIRMALDRKHREHGPMGELWKTQDRSMVEIGG